MFLDCRGVTGGVRLSAKPRHLQRAHARPGQYESGTMMKDGAMSGMLYCIAGSIRGDPPQKRSESDRGASLTRMIRTVLTPHGFAAGVFFPSRRVFYFAWFLFVRDGLTRAFVDLCLFATIARPLWQYTFQYFLLVAPSYLHILRPFAPGSPRLCRCRCSRFLPIPPVCGCSFFGFVSAIGQSVYAC